MRVAESDAKKSRFKKVGIVLLAIFLFGGASLGGYRLWNRCINYNFGTITHSKVYKSAAIRPSTLEKLIIDYKIKPVIDLRNEVSDRYHQEEIAAAVGKIEGTRYVNIRSPQVPNRQHLIQFLEVLDQPDRYPVLIHCYHGLGRTMLSSAIYRMEYENMSNSEARGQTRFIVESPAYRSSFAAHEPKGAFLINSKPRQVGRFATVNMMS